MALVRNIRLKAESDRARRVHKEIKCQCASFEDDAGNHYIQLDTFSSSSQGRNVVQIMQFDKTAATQLKALIEKTWAK